MSFRLSKTELKEARAYMARENARHGLEFVPAVLPPWAPKPPLRMLRALRNKHFLVQEYRELCDMVIVRLSIQRTMLNDRGEWLDGITWEQLQAVKDAIGYADHEAVEIYPRQAHIVNVANIRHLWILRTPLPFGWGDDK